VISISYGECEAVIGQAGNAAFLSAYQSAAAAGVSVFVSSGDQLSSSCSQSLQLTATSASAFQSGAPRHTTLSVGGNGFEDTYNAKRGEHSHQHLLEFKQHDDRRKCKVVRPEIPWNDSCASWLLSNYEGYGTTYGTAGFCNSTTGKNNYLTIGGASGGPSGCANGASTNGYVTAGCAGYAKPVWQSGVFGNPADGVRDMPDVAMFAATACGTFLCGLLSDTTFYSADGAATCGPTPNPLASTPSWSGFWRNIVAAPLMAGIQALVNQKWGTREGNPNPIYYQIAKAEFGSSGESACYAINQPARAGLASSCAFNDITQGDINAVCQQNNPYFPATSLQVPTCVLSTEPAATVSVITGGSATPARPRARLERRPHPRRIFHRRAQRSTQAAHRRVVARRTSFREARLSRDGCGVRHGGHRLAGATVTVGSTTYTLVTGAPTAANQVELYTASRNNATNETDTAKNLEAVLNATATQCTGGGGCVFGTQTANASAAQQKPRTPLTLTARTNGAAGTLLCRPPTTSTAISFQRLQPLARGRVT